MELSTQNINGFNQTAILAKAILNNYKLFRHLKAAATNGRDVRHKSFCYLGGLNKTDMDFQLVTGRPDTIDHLVFTTSFTQNNIFYKAALAETISWAGHLTGTYDVLLQSDKGTQRLTLINDGEHWVAGQEVEQIGIIQQEVVDLLGAVIKEVRR